MATGRVPTTANSPLTAKGDLFGYSTTQARVAVGNDGETLVADSSTSTGLRYQASISAGRNFLINGGFDIWQRGTSFSAPNAYIADRWFAAGSGTWTQDTTTLAPGQQYSLKATTTSLQAIAVYQSIETKNSIPLAGQTATFSFYLAASTASTVYATLDYSTSTDVAPTGSWTNISTNTVSVTTSMVRSTITAAIPSGAKSLRVSYYTGNLASGTSVYFGANQLEIGSVATAFSRAGGNIQGELSAAQRYYYRASFATNESLGTVNFASATLAQMVLTMPVQMRSDPAFAAGATNIIAIYTNAFFGSSNITLDAVSNRTVSLNVTVSGGTIGQAGIAYLNLNANNFLEFSSEL
jgi:hypothetical protein